MGAKTKESPKSRKVSRKVGGCGEQEVGLVFVPGPRTTKFDDKSEKLVDWNIGLDEYAIWELLKRELRGTGGNHIYAVAEEEETGSYFIVSSIKSGGKPKRAGRLDLVGRPKINIDNSLIYSSDRNSWQGVVDEAIYHIKARVVRNPVFDTKELDSSKLPADIDLVRSLLKSYCSRYKKTVKVGKKVRLGKDTFALVESIEDIANGCQVAAMELNPRNLLVSSISLTDPLNPERVADRSLLPIGPISRQFYVSPKSYPTYSLDDVIMSKRNKDKMEILIDRIRNPEGYLPDKGSVILFSGPPGTGKTMAAKAIPNHIGKGKGKRPAFFHISCASLQRPNVGETAEMVDDLFKDLSEVADHRPTVAVFDEFDAVGMSRVFMGVHGGVNESVNSMLTKLDYPPAGLHAILITNHLGILDDALQSRCKEVFFFDLPKSDEILRFMGMLLDKYKVKGKEYFDAGLYIQDNIIQLVKKFEENNLSYRDIELDVIAPARRKVIYRRSHGEPGAVVNEEVLRKEFDDILAERRGRVSKVPAGIYA